ncbi:MAG: UDP-2,4-diacetamido-2,4,6-trideoxy-beta-L-altropyranose hydrolase [Candidatus Omnitrophota bacterium]|jgi:spore coat polysaccharide biosynthesis predicted glycosyltransferase SpsG
MKRDALILTEGGKSFGFGHIARCTALYQAFESRGFQPRLVINGDGSVPAFIQGLNADLLCWLEDGHLNNLLATGPDVVVIDSYWAPEPVYRAVSETVRAAVYLDDYKRLSYPPGFVVNGTAHAEQFLYPSREGTAYLLGEHYVPLRSAFWDVSPVSVRETVANVLLTMGGSDMKQGTPLCYQAIKAEYPAVKKTVILGHGCLPGSALKEQADKQTEFVSALDARQMKARILEADLAVSAGGQTLYELARCGVPTLAVCVADNQSANVRGLSRKGVIEYCGRMDDPDVFTNLRAGLRKFSDKGLRQGLSEAGKSCVDGQGAIRIVDAVVSAGAMLFR